MPRGLSVHVLHYHNAGHWRKKPDIYDFGIGREFTYKLILVFLNREYCEEIIEGIISFVTSGCCNHQTHAL